MARHRKRRGDAASVASAKTDRHGKSIGCVDIEAASTPQAHREPLRWICDGRDELGAIFTSAEGFTAATPAGKLLGVFATIDAARAAIFGART